MNSDGHRRNILNSRYKHMGYGKTNAFDTQVFGSQSSVSLEESDEEGEIGDAVEMAAEASDDLNLEEVRRRR